MDSVLDRRTICYNFKNLQEFQSQRKRTVFYGLETISYTYPIMYNFCRKSLNKETHVLLTIINIDFK